MRVLPLTILVCSFILSAGAMAASPAQSAVGVPQVADAPVLKKAPRLRKPKADDAITQSADAAPAAVGDKNGRFVKKQNPQPVPEQQSAPAPAPAKAPNSVPSSAVTTKMPGATARCQDGTFSHSKQHSGSCSRHGGVAQWLTE